MAMVNKITLKGKVAFTAANQTHQITDGTQITPTPGGGSIGAMLQLWIATDQTAVTFDVIIGSTSVIQGGVPNYRAEEGTTGQGLIVDFQGVKINEDQVIADQLIGPSTPISIIIRGNAATMGLCHYLVVMEPLYPEGAAAA